MIGEEKLKTCQNFTLNWLEIKLKFDLVILNIGLRLNNFKLKHSQVKSTMGHMCHGVGTTRQLAGGA